MEFQVLSLSQTTQVPVLSLLKPSHAKRYQRKHSNPYKTLLLYIPKENPDIVNIKKQTATETLAELSVIASN